MNYLVLIVLFFYINLISMAANSNGVECEKSVTKAVAFFNGPYGMVYIAYLTTLDIIGTIGLTPNKLQLFFAPKLDLLQIERQEIYSEVYIPLSVNSLTLLRHSAHKSSINDMFRSALAEFAVDIHRGIYCKNTNFIKSPLYKERQQLEICCLYRNDKKTNRNDENLQTVQFPMSFEVEASISESIP